MTTPLRHETTYPAAPDAVGAMLRNTDFRERVLAAQHVLRGTVTTTGDTLEIEQVHSASGIPSFAQKFVGSEIVIIQRESWTAADLAEVDMGIPGKPGEITGQRRLVASGEETRGVVELSIRVGVPLVGGKIEKLIADMLTKALDKEHSVGLDWLTEG